MSENCSHNCGSCSSDCSSRKPADFLVPPNEHSKIKKVIAVVSRERRRWEIHGNLYYGGSDKQKGQKNSYSGCGYPQAIPSLRHLV